MGVAFGSDSAPVGGVGVGTIVGVGVAVGFGRETASGSVAGEGSEDPSIDTDCPWPVCVITIRLMPRLTRAKATRVMGMDRTTDVSLLNGLPPIEATLVGESSSRHCQRVVQHPTSLTTPHYST